MVVMFLKNSVVSLSTTLLEVTLVWGISSYFKRREKKIMENLFVNILAGSTILGRRGLT